MTKKIFWVHDKSLSVEHIFLQNLDAQSKAIFIWDDDYFQSRAYSLKRLVFIYESICQMPIEIIKGNIFEIMQSYAPEKITIAFTADTKIKEIIKHLTKLYEIEVIKPKNFVDISDNYQFERFFQYWSKAKKSAFFKNGVRL